MSNSSIRPINMILAGGWRSDENEEVLHIPQISIIRGALPSYCLVSYRGHSVEDSYPSAVMQSAYFTAPEHIYIVRVPLNIYPRTGVYFSHEWSRGSLALDPSQNQFQLRFLLRAHRELADNERVNLGLDWPPLARGFHFSRSHTPIRPPRFPTPSIMEDMGL